MKKSDSEKMEAIAKLVKENSVLTKSNYVILKEGVLSTFTPYLNKVYVKDMKYTGYKKISYTNAKLGKLINYDIDKLKSTDDTFNDFDMVMTDYESGKKVILETTFKNFINYMEKCYTATSKDNNSTLSCCNITNDYIASTDGNRIHYSKNNSLTLKNAENLLVQKHVIKELMTLDKVLKFDNIQVVEYADHEIVYILDDQLFFVTSKIYGTYPRVEQLITSNLKNCCTIEVKKALKAFKELKPCILKSNKYKYANIDIKDNNMTITVDGYSKNIEITSYFDLNFNMNLLFLIDAFEVMLKNKIEHTELETGDFLYSAKQFRGSNIISLIMPVQIKK